MECTAECQYGKVVGVVYLPEDFFEQQRLDACERDDTGVLAIHARLRAEEEDAKHTSAEVIV